MAMNFLDRSQNQQVSCQFSSGSDFSQNSTNNEHQWTHSTNQSTGILFIFYWTIIETNLLKPPGQASPQAELRAAAVRRMTARSAQRRAEAVPFAPPARGRGAQPKTPPLREVVTVDEAVGVYGGSRGFTMKRMEQN